MNSIAPKLFQKYASDPAAFRADLLVDVDGTVRRFGDVQDPFQRDDFAALDPGLMRCNGHGDDADAKMRVWLERARGHSKTTDLAVTCCWIMAFATRPLRGYAFAADKDQAGLLKNAMETLIRLNPWLGSILEVQKNAVINIAKGHPGYGSTLEIFTSDVASSYGILPDFIICDEVTHWTGDGGLFHSIISSAAKRSNCLLVCISNAGFVDSWAWAVREAARTDEAWYFSRLDGPVASWMTEARLAEQRRMLPNIAYQRLWENLWSSGGGDALTPEIINRAFVDGLEPMEGRCDGYKFVAGVDLGLTRDCSALVVLAVPDSGKGGKIRLAHNKLWRPIPGKKINLLDVERYILALDESFGLENVGCDSWQSEHLMQTLEVDAGHRRRNQRRIYNSQPWMRDMPPTASNLRQQASLTIEFFNDGRVQLYECAELRRDLHKLRVEEKPSGVRLVSPRDGEGHGDTFSAFALALLLAHELAGKKPVVISPDNFARGHDLEAWSRRQAEYEEAQREMNQADTSNGLLDAILNGDVYHSPFSF